ncbi:MAG: FKBP-type peptidyl-prolyl cis-trans isomerase [Woeseiaceae bacterium]|jgi:FKBP-type peptidyl-prolyl cis-trans isomerase
MKLSDVLATSIVALTLAGCGPAEQQSAKEGDATSVAQVACPTADDNGNVEIAPGLSARITNKGYGRVAVSGDYADVHTTLWLYDENAAAGRGTEIWSSGGEQPFQFQLDAGQVIRGWDLGVACMLVGETRELKIAPDLGYGARGKPPVPPNATLLFEIELVKLTESRDPAS